MEQSKLNFPCRRPITRVLLFGLTSCLFTAQIAAQELLFLGIREGKQSLFAYTPQGVTRLTGPENADMQPHVAPDGSAILYTSNRDRNLEIFRKDLVTGEVVNLSNSPTPETSAIWSPDAGKIAYVAIEADGGPAIYQMGPQGEDKQRLLATELDIGELAWAPNGQQLAFLQADSDKRNIYVLDLKSKVVTALTSEGDNYEINWASDSKSIYFISRRSRNEDIYHLDLGSMRESHITESAETEGGISLSPDGRTILFERNGPNARTDLWLRSLDSGDELNLTRNSDSADFNASWMAAGKQVVFVSFRDGNGELYRINSDGSGLERLTHHPAYDSHPIPLFATN